MKSSLLLMLLALCLPAVAQTDTNPTVKARLSVLNEIFPSEKIYVHTDRSFYSTGEFIYFKAYVVNGETHLPDNKTRVVSVNLVDARGSVIKNLQLPLDKGSASGSFHLSNLPGGIYHIKAFTNWTGNQGESCIFDKEITVRRAVYSSLLLKMETALQSYLPGQRVDAWVTASDLDQQPIAGSPVQYELRYQAKKIKEGILTTDQRGKAVFSFDVPADATVNDLVLTAYVEHEGKKESVFRPVILQFDDVSLALLPEGGNLVNGLPSVVAFRAIGANGKPVEVHGTVMDETGKPVTDFVSVKYGMGSFSFTPVAGHTYTARVQMASGREKHFLLPPAESAGITVQCVRNDKNQLFAHLYASENNTVKLVWQAHGQVYLEKEVALLAGQNILALPVDSISPGIATLTLFRQQRPLCERLVFVNSHQTLRVDLKTDKEKYGPFENVQLDITVKDHLGKPVQGGFSLAVVDERNLVMANDRQDNILSSLLLTGELHGKIEDPSIYFSKNEPLAAELLDLVMLTHGWRRFKWNELMHLNAGDWKKRLVYNRDVNGYSGVVLPDSYESVKEGIKVTIYKPTRQTVLADSNGVFFLAGQDLRFPLKARFRKNGYSEKQWLHKSDLSPYITPVSYQPFSTVKEQMPVVEILEQSGRKKEQVTDLENPDEMNAISSVANLEEVQVMSSIPGVISADRLQMTSVAAYRVSLIDPFSTGYDYFYYGRPSFNPRNRFSIGRLPGSYDSYLREFYAPVYDGSNKYLQEHDDRTTLYWKSNVVTDTAGKASVRFSTCKNVSAYTARLEGLGTQGGIGLGETGFFVQKPLSVEVKLPVVVTRGDHFVASCVLYNRTTENLKVSLGIDSSPEFDLEDQPGRSEIEIPANGFIVKDIAVDVRKNVSAGTKETAPYFSISLQSGQLVDKIKQQITVNHSGFDHFATAGGNEKQKTFSFEISQPMDGALDARLEMITNPFKELDQALQGMIREPHGCFEQVSASNYPNILALQYLQKTGKADPELTRTAMERLNSGYRQLARYETSEGGFEWYGHTPPHEALTAFGLMQFYEMKQLGIAIDEKLYDRTIGWLMGRRTNEGLFMQNQGKYGFAGAPRATSSAYITYALSCLGKNDLARETEAIEKELRKTFDFYKMALLANTYFHLGNAGRGRELVAQLVAHVEKNGIEKIKTGPSFTYCYNPVVECIALLTIAIAENNLAEYRNEAAEYAGYIYSKRSYGGHFGSTQQTVMAVKALLLSRQFMGETHDINGELLVTVNGRQLPAYRISQETDISDLSLGQYLVEGRNTISLVCSNSGDRAPAYSFGASWKTRLPQSGSSSQQVKIETVYAAAAMKRGETARLTVQLSNTTSEGLPQTVAVVGIPAGMSFDSAELKRLMEDRLFDYYELRDNYLILYYAELAPDARMDIPLNLKCDIAGRFITPPACAYIYYNPDIKSWSTADAVTID